MTHGPFCRTPGCRWGGGGAFTGPTPSKPLHSLQSGGHRGVEVDGSGVSDHAAGDSHCGEVGDVGGGPLRSSH